MTESAEPYVGEVYDLTVFDSHLRDRFKRLEDRLLWCRECIYEGRGSPNSINRYKSEVSALEWALRVINKYYAEHPKEADTQKPVFPKKGDSV